MLDTKSTLHWDYSAKTWFASTCILTSQQIWGNVNKKQRLLNFYLISNHYLQVHVSSKKTCFFFVHFPGLFLLQVSLATFAVYVLLGNELTAGKAFVAISLFNILRFPLTVLPRVVMNFIQVCRAFQRTLLHLTDGEQFSVAFYG